MVVRPQGLHNALGYPDGSAGRCDLDSRVFWEPLALARAVLRGVLGLAVEK
jgi:hypothetical protein